MNVGSRAGRRPIHHSPGRLSGPGAWGSLSINIGLRHVQAAGAAWKQWTGPHTSTTPGGCGGGLVAAGGTHGRTWPVQREPQSAACPNCLPSQLRWCASTTTGQGGLGYEPPDIYFAARPSRRAAAGGRRTALLALTHRRDPTIGLHALMSRWGTELRWHQAASCGGGGLLAYPTGASVVADLVSCSPPSPSAPGGPSCPQRSTEAMH